MTRSFYHLIVRMHPPAFRCRFGDEMLSIFDEEDMRGSALLFDGLASFARQWLLRSDSWKFLIAIGGGFLQVFGFGMPIKGHQSWTGNHQPLTLSVYAIVMFALALTCTLFILITSITVWNASFQRRRSQLRKGRPAGLSTARHLSRSNHERRRGYRS